MPSQSTLLAPFGRYVEAQELASLKRVLEKRDAHIETLEKSLVQLSIEWYSMGEENKKFAASHAHIQERRKEAIFKRIRNMSVSKAFNKWRHEVDIIVQAKMEKTLDSAEEAIELLQEELHETKKQTRQLEQYVEDRRAKFVKMMLNMPVSRAFRTWAANVGHSKVATATKRVEVQKEIASEAKREVKRAERDVKALEAELARYKGIVMEHRKRSMAAMVAKMRSAALGPAFRTWMTYVHREHVAVQMERAAVLEQRVEEQQVKVMRVQKVLSKAQVRAIRKMKNAGILAAWTKWRDFMGGSKLSRAVAETEEVKLDVEELEQERRRLWGVVRTMGVRVVRKTFKQIEARYFEKWRQVTKMTRMLTADRALRTVLNLTRAKAFRHWRSLVVHEIKVQEEEEYRRETEDFEKELEEMRSDRDYWENLANRAMGNLRKSAGRALKQMYHGAAYKALVHWHRVAKIAKRYGHMQAIVDRAKVRALERIVNRLVHPAFAKWKYIVLNWNRERAEAEAEENDRLLLEAREETRRWREAAERGWGAVQRMGHRALRRMINAHMWRAFGHWKKLAQASGALRSYRRAAEAKIEDLERKLLPLEAEVGALRLFKDAMASSERTMIMRKGGGFIALEEYVATVENRISAAALEEALEGKPRGEELARRYGLDSALQALRGAELAEHGEVISPRGGFTSWRHAPQMAQRSPRRRRKTTRAGESSDDSTSDDDDDEAAAGLRLRPNRGHYGPGHSQGGRQRAYEAPQFPADVSLKVKYKPSYSAAPEDREPLEGDGDRLGAVGGIGAAAVSRKRLLKGKISIDAERAQRLATRRMNLAYDPPVKHRGLDPAARDVYDDASEHGALTDRSDAASWRGGVSGLDTARSDASDKKPVGFSDVGSLRDVAREDPPEKRAQSRGAKMSAARARDADERARERRMEQVAKWVPDVSDTSEDEDKGDTAAGRRRRRGSVEAAAAQSEAEAEAEAARRRRGPRAGVAGGARVTGRGLRDPGWDTDSEDRLEMGKILSGAETTDDEEFVPLSKTRVR